GSASRPGEGSGAPCNQRVLTIGIPVTPGCRKLLGSRHQLRLPRVQGCTEHAHHLPGKRTRPNHQVLGGSSWQTDHGNGRSRGVQTSSYRRSTATGTCGERRSAAAALLFAWRSRYWLVTATYDSGALHRRAFPADLVLSQPMANAGRQPAMTAGP